MVINPAKSGHQHFSGSGANIVVFERSINRLLITVDSATTLSFDRGANYMTMTAGTYDLQLGSMSELYIGAGVWSGMGLAI